MVFGVCVWINVKSVFALFLIFTKEIRGSVPSGVVEAFCREMNIDCKTS